MQKRPQLEQLHTNDLNYMLFFSIKVVGPLCNAKGFQLTLLITTIYQALFSYFI